MSKSEIQVLDFEKICRLCLLEKRSMSAIFSKKKSDKKVPLPVRIMSCASLELYEGDGLPASICNKCLMSVNQSYAFREQCEQADTTLRQYAQRLNEANEEASTDGCGVLEDKIVLTNDQNGVQLNDENFDSFLDTSTFLETTLIDTEERILTFNDNHVKIETKNQEDTISRMSKKENLENMKERKPTKRIVFQCHSCPRIFQSVMRRNRHLKMAHGDAYLCQTCGRVFDKIRNISSHRRRCGAEKSQFCSVCSRGFYSRTELNNHLKIHTGEKPHVCKFCSKKFRMKNALDRHFITHTDLKPFECKECGKAFNKRWNYTQHVRLHTDERPYACDICGQAFRHNVSMKEHRAKHITSL